MDKLARQRVCSSANRAIEEIYERGGVQNVSNLEHIKKLSDFLSNYSGGVLEDEEFASFCSNFATLVTELSTLLESKLRNPTVISIDSDEEEDEKEQATSEVLQAIHDSDTYDLLKNKFGGHVKVLQKQVDKSEGCNSESIDYYYTIEFGVSKQLILNFDATIRYDPCEEGSDGSFSANCELKQPGQEEEIYVTIFENEDEVDYCIGYGGGKTDFESVAMIAHFFGLDGQELLLLWEMMIATLKSVSSDAEHVEDMLENVSELQIPSSSRSQQGSTKSGKQTSRSSTKRYGPY